MHNPPKTRFLPKGPLPPLQNSWRLQPFYEKQLSGLSQTNAHHLALHRSSTHRVKEQRRRSNYKLSFGMGGRFRRPKKASGSSCRQLRCFVSGDWVIGPNQEREFNDNLLPVVQVGPTIRMISYFVA